MYILFAKQAEQLSLQLRLGGMKITKEAAVKTREKSL
jgi:hypothetical protein